MTKIKNSRPTKKISSSGRKLIEDIRFSKESPYQYKLDYLRLNWYLYHDWYNETWKLWKTGDTISYVSEIDRCYRVFLVLDK